METEETRKIFWERYLHEVDIHKSYLDLAVKLNVFYYAITGAIVSFYFVHVQSEPMAKYSLVLPIFMSTLLAIFFYKGAKGCRISQKEIEELAVGMGFETCSIVADILRCLLWVLGVGQIIVAIGLSILLMKDINFCGSVG